MTDVEYGEKYTLYLTPHGVEYLTNRVSMGIMDLLHRSAMTVTELADALDQQKTSIQSNLKKLEMNEFVSSYIDKNDRRRVIYVPASIPFIKPTTPIPEMIHEDIIKALLKKKANKFRISLLLTATEFYKVGVSISPLMERCGMLLAIYAKKDFMGKDLDAIIKNIEKNLRTAEFPQMTITTDNDEIYMTAKAERGLNKEFVLGIDVASGYVREAIKQGTKAIYEISDTDTYPDGKIVIRFKPYNGILPINSIRNNLIADKKIVKKELTLCYANGHSILFGNSVQTKILNFLSNENAGLKAVTEALEIPTVTAHRNLRILEQTGVISRMRGKTNTEFTLNGTIILTDNGRTVNMENTNIKFFEIAAKDPAKYFEAIFGYINSVFRRAGFEINNIQKRIGMSMAEGFVRGYEITDAMTFLEIIKYADSALNIKSKITCYIPLTVSLKNDTFTTEDFQFIKSFYMGLITHGLKLTTGDDYNVRLIQNNSKHLENGNSE